MMLTARFTEALTLAQDLHDGQLRKGTPIPFFAHLLAVSSLVIETGAGLDDIRLEDAAIGALLHDVLEDQGDKIALEDIEARFGAYVALVVRQCSDAVVTRVGEAKPAWRIRKEQYLASIPGKCRESLLVTAADKLHNLRCIIDDHARLGTAIWKRFNAPRQDQIWYHTSLHDQLGFAWRDNPLLPPLGRTVRALATLE